MSTYCQICLHLQPEDLAIIHEMLKEAGATQKDLPELFKNPKFRKCLAQVFDSKYLEISECQHEKLTKVFALEAGSRDLDVDRLSKRLHIHFDKLNKLKEHIDRLASSLFNGETLETDDEEQESNVPSSPEVQTMNFNKNSNKNKFQKRSIDILKKWFLEHLDNPYPDTNEKNRLSTVTGMHVRQIQNWFTNSRKRYLEPLKKKFDGHRLPNYKDQSSEEEEQDESEEEQEVVEPQIKKEVKIQKEPEQIIQQQPIIYQEPIIQPVFLPNPLAYQQQMMQYQQYQVQIQMMMMQQQMAQFYQQQPPFYMYKPE